MQQHAHTPALASIPMMDPAPLHALLREEIDAAIAQVIHGGRFVLGDAMEAFEEYAAEYLGVRHAVGVASGTDALLLSLKAAGIGAGDEVITSPFTFWVTAEAIHHAGAKPVYVDISDTDMNIDVSRIEAAITPATRAIMPVHIFGQCADTDAINAIARKHDLVMIEDAAQAFGAKNRNRHAGSFGLAGCFSFHPAKPLGAFGDGGLIATNDPEFANILRRLRNHGSIARYSHAEFGYNSRLDSLQAAILNVKLKHLDSTLHARRESAAVYQQMLEGAPVRLPRNLPQQFHIYAQYTILCEQRDQLQEMLAAAGIESAVHYPAPLYRQPACERDYQNLHLPIAENTSRTCLSLPLYFGLRPQQQQQIADVIHAFRH